MVEHILPLREGRTLIALLAGATAAVALVGWWPLFAPLLSLTGMALVFFRNPPRHPPEVEGAILSPADGKVISVEKRHTPWGETGWKVSVFMSLWDVHVNRSPAEAIVKKRDHRPGRFLPAYKPEAPERNEQNLLVLETLEGHPLAVVQVAGIIARRVLCRVGPGDRLRRGEPFGAILLGSRVDLYLPEGARISVKAGERVRAGESVVGFLS